MSSIIIVIPYFGNWPFWINVFLASCAKNQSVDFLLLGDCGRPDYLPANVKFEEVSFIDYKKRVARALGITFDPLVAYKLCDIKPMLGKIHEQDISDYDFWAFGDLDLVYGDLRAVYTEELLSKYDLISNHATRVSGHLCLIRNTQFMREVYQKVPGWQEKIESQKHVAFDEKAFSKLFVKHKNFPKILRRLFNVFYPLSRKSYFVENYTTPNGCITWRDGSSKFPKKWYWSNGSIKNDLDDETCYPYFHFAVWKKKYWVGNEFDRLEKIDLTCIYEFSSEGIRAVQYNE